MVGEPVGSIRRHQGVGDTVPVPWGAWGKPRGEGVRIPAVGGKLGAAVMGHKGERMVLPC